MHPSLRCTGDDGGRPRAAAAGSSENADCSAAPSRDSGSGRRSPHTALAVVMGSVSQLNAASRDASSASVCAVASRRPRASIAERAPLPSCRLHFLDQCGQRRLRHRRRSREIPTGGRRANTDSRPDGVVERVDVDRAGLVGQVQRAGAGSCSSRPSTRSAPRSVEGLRDVWFSG